MSRKSSNRNNVFENFPVIDATKPLVITVTANDIKQSAKKTNATCAIATAVKREYGVKQIRVHLSRTYIMGVTKKRWLRYLTPTALRAEIIVFDRGGQFMPERYTLLIPPKDTYKNRVRRDALRKKLGSALRAVIRQKDKHVLSGVRLRHNNGTNSSGRPKSLYDRRFKKPVLRSGTTPVSLA